MVVSTASFQSGSPCTTQLCLGGTKFPELIKLNPRSQTKAQRFPWRFCSSRLLFELELAAAVQSICQNCGGEPLRTSRIEDAARGRFRLANTSFAICCFDVCATVIVPVVDLDPADHVLLSRLLPLSRPRRPHSARNRQLHIQPPTSHIHEITTTTPVPTTMDRDPWYWDSEEVVTFFHDHAAQTLPEVQRSRLPINDEFFEALQSEGVTGDCLLTAIDIAALRDEYGVKSAMTRSAVWSCICKLRMRSVAYATQNGLPTLQAPTPKSLPPANLPETPLQPALDPAVASTEEGQTDTRTGENARSGEYQVQDAQGRKRRKLNLSKLEPSSAQRTTLSQSKEYLPNARILVDEIFYGSTGYGEEIENLPTDGTITVLDADRDDGLDDNDFQFQYQDNADGESEFVYKYMQRMFMQAELEDMQRHGREAVAMLPYPQTQSATVVQFTSEHEEQPVAFKENVTYLHSTAPEKHAAAGGEWDFLMEKYAASEDPTLPEYGNSETDLGESKPPGDDEDEDDDGTSMAEESLAADELSNERASEFIEEVLKKYQLACDARVQSWEEKKAYKTWKRMEGSRTIRQELIESARMQIDHMGKRIRNQKEHLLESQWKSEASLEHVCRSMQATVEDIEFHKWMIDVWGRRQEPWHARSKKKTRARSEHKQHSKANDAAPARPVIPENDRFSVSPPPAEPQDDSAVNNENNSYEADNEEEFHTPVASPEPQQQFPDAVAGAEEVEDPTFVVDDDVDVYENDELVERAGLGMPQPSSTGKTRSNRALAGSDIEPDLPSPSDFEWDNLKREPLPSTPSNRRIMSIDLTGGSPSSGAPTPTSKKHGKLSNKDSVTANPDIATAEEIDEWSMSELVRYGDRKRILLKILRNAGESVRSDLHKCYLSLQRARFSKQLRETLESLRDEDPGTFEDDRGDPLRLAAGIYLRWHFPALLTTALPADIPWDSALVALQVNAFSGMLEGLLRLKDTPKFKSPKNKSSVAPGSSSANAISLSSDNELAALSQQTPRKKRKRAVEQSQTALGNRQKAFERMRRADLAESQSAANSSQLAAMIDANPTQSSVDINSLRDEDQPPLYVSRKIAVKMKQHQIEGARFLWREITASDDDGGHGCVLAHAMGLGKTMQTIALLAAVNEAAHSENKAIRSQLPRHLRRKKMRDEKRNLRTLILCPAGLIQNWNREIGEWVNKRLGHIFCLGSSVQSASRPAMVEDWMRTGGVLIVGYEMFRSLAKPNSGKRPKKAALGEEDAAELVENLLNGPEIVVADEAHNLKNEKSGVAIAAKRFKTESKIALTGTPMSNDVSEIYALVSWVSPDYLGEPTEFKAIFAEPIKEGLYADSTRYEQRKSIMKLQVLHREIRPKVHRANIEALRGSIPPKVEFVIFVSLQQLQEDLYRRYIRAVKAFIDSDKREDGTQKTSQVVFMSMLAVLTLLTGHPCSFRDKLLEPPKEKKGKTSKDGQSDGIDTESDAGGKTPSTTSGSATPLNPEITTAQELADAEADKAIDAHVSAQGLTPETVHQILDGDGSDIGTDPALSSKLTIFLHLLRSALAVRDRVIVFSQRLNMLDYLERLFKTQKIAFGRIDGSNMAQRMPLLEKFEEGAFSVMLVSTKAGGVGLNMQWANRVFIFDSGFNPTYEEQAIGRAYRLGQKKPVYVYRFVAAGTFETNIYNKQLFKTSLAQRVVDKKNPRRTAERNTRDYLYEPKDVPQQDITEHISKDTLVLGKLLKQHGSGNDQFDTMIRDVKTMETLTEEIMDEPLDQEEQKAVEEETEARKQRPRGKKAAAMAAGLSSTVSPPGYAPPLPGAANVPNIRDMAPPPSTYGGRGGRPNVPPSSTNPTTFMGGLPMPRRT